MEPVGFEPGICLSRPKSHLVNANELVIGHNWRVSIDHSSAAGQPTSHRASKERKGKLSLTMAVDRD